MLNSFQNFLQQDPNFQKLRDSYEQKKNRYPNVEIKGLKETKELDKRNFATFDTETRDGLKGKELFCYSLCFIEEKTNKTKVIQNTDSELQDFFTFFENRVNKAKTLDREETKVLSSQKLEEFIIFVHNLSFDERFIRSELVKRNIKFFVIASGSNIIGLRIPDLKCRFVDSVQYLQESQEDAEKTWKVPLELTKIDCKFLFDMNYEKWSENDKQLVLAHNKNDVLALRDIMQKVRTCLFNLANVDVLQFYSIASLSVKAFKKNLDIFSEINPFLFIKMEKKKRIQYDLSKIEADFCREGYFGGRTEVFDINRHENVKYFDKVSLYPSVLCKKYPCDEAYWELNERELNQHINTLDKLGMIYAEIKHPNNEMFPILPSRKNDRVIFDCEDKIAVFTSVELNYARNHGYEIKPVLGFMFEGKKHLFRSHIKKMFKLKQQSEGGMRLMAKLLMNSLYGKFGESYERLQYTTQFYDSKEEACIAFAKFVDEEVKCCPIRFFADENKYGVDIANESISLKPYMNVVWAAFCTGYGRIELHKGIENLHKHNIRSIYCDTDSIVSTEKAEQYLKIGNKLGNWQIEHTFEEAKFFAPKLYAFREYNKKTDAIELKMKLKGLDRSTIKELLGKCLTVEDIEGVFKNQKIEIKERYGTLRISASHGKILYSRKVEKQFTFANEKREILGDGTTRPWGAKV